MNYQLPTIEFQGEEITLNHVSSLQSGYGHKKITVEIEYKNEKKSFTKTTNNMPGHDAATEIEDYNEKQVALFELVSNDLDEQIVDWMVSVDENQTK